MGFNHLCHVFRQRSLEQDIQTATRRMRDAIEVAEESRQRFKDFAEAASEWFWSTDADDRFTVITYAQKKVSHIDESEFIGSRRLDLTTEDTNTYKWKVYRETLANRKFLTDFEYAVWTKENGEQYVRINGKPFFDKDGDFQGYRGTARNITDETALRVRNRELFQRMFGGSSSVAPDSTWTNGQLDFGTDAVIPYLQEFSSKVHGAGAALMVQISHLGRRSEALSRNWLPALAPSPIRETLHRSNPREMDRHDIDRIVKAFGEAAYRCKEGGLDGLETMRPIDRDAVFAKIDDLFRDLRAHQPGQDHHDYACPKLELRLPKESRLARNRHIAGKR